MLGKFEVVLRAFGRVCVLTGVGDLVGSVHGAIVDNVALADDVEAKVFAVECADDFVGHRGGVLDDDLTVDRIGIVGGEDR